MRLCGGEHCVSRLRYGAYALRGWSPRRLREPSYLCEPNCLHGRSASPAPGGPCRPADPRDPGDPGRRPGRCAVCGGAVCGGGSGAFRRRSLSSPALTRSPELPGSFPSDRHPRAARLPEKISPGPRPAILVRGHSNERCCAWESVFSNGGSKVWRGWTHRNGAIAESDSTTQDRRGCRNAWCSASM